MFCRKNCSGSPHCLNGLGEKKWLSDDEPVISYTDPDSLKRGEVWYKLLLILIFLSFFSRSYSGFSGVPHKSTFHAGFLTD